MKYQAGNIQNVIFDLGEVLLDLAIPRTLEQFSIHAGKSIHEIKEIYYSSDVFLSYEKGLIGDDEFRHGVNRVFGTNLSVDQLELVWNGMLADLPKERLELLKKLNSSYRLFLLSNTNEIHLRKFTEMIQKKTGAESLDHFFEKAYYSHRIKMRKPDAEIFEYVLNDSNLKASETLFLDDNTENIEGATRLGILTHQVKHPSVLFTLFK